MSLLSDFVVIHSVVLVLYGSVIIDVGDSVHVVIFGEKRSSKSMCRISAVFCGLLPGLQRSFFQCPWCLYKVPLQWEGGELLHIL
jgi:hypothetical protein